ncbi:MAG: BlaI/MecI/CopY family transcriptional regulator [Gemmatimonadaceae bacterium]
MTPPRLQQTARLDSRGLAKVLGDLEAKVMSAVWKTSSPASAREIHERIVRHHPVKLLTVVTVLNKLVAKRLLKRSAIDGLLRYTARQTRAEFDAYASRRLVEGVLGFSRDLVAASLVDVLAETDPEALEELSRLVKARLREQKRR